MATIASGIVEQADVTVPIIFAGLVGAILWNVITWYLGIPSSSSHALVGGVVGSVIAGAGTGSVIWSGIASKVVIPALLAPFVCGLAAYLATTLAYRLTRSIRRESAGEGFRFSQIASSSLVAPAHGTNDAPASTSRSRSSSSSRIRQASTPARKSSRGDSPRRAQPWPVRSVSSQKTVRSRFDARVDEAILARAEEIGASEIVLGCRSRSSIRSLILGDVANEVAQRQPSPCSSYRRGTSRGAGARS